MLAFILLFALHLFGAGYVHCRCPFSNFDRLNVQILHTWNTPEFTFLRGPRREEAIRAGIFVPEMNSLSSIEVLNGEIFVNIRRTETRSTNITGIPSTLNRVVNIGRESFLEPFPSLAAQAIEDCNALQNVGNFVVDKAGGNIWAVDMGTVTGVPLCPPKLVIISIRRRRIIRRHIFPATVFNQRSGFMDAIALDNAGGPIARFAYIGDVRDGRLIVVDILADASWRFQDSSTLFDTCGTRIVFGNNIIKSFGSIENLAVSPDSRFLYWSPIASFSVFQVPTVILRNPESVLSNFVREIGEFPFQIFDFVIGSNCSYYAEVPRSAINAWDRLEDINRSMGEDNIRLRTLQNMLRDERFIEFPLSITLDRGFLYFLNLRFQPDFSGMSGPNFAIGRVFINDM